jgi:hypothetical protein
MAIAALVVLGAGGPASAEPTGIQVGFLRVVQNRAGIPLRAEPNALADILGTLPYATRLRVTELSGYWMRVSVQGAPTAEGSPQAGWVKKGQTVESLALTGAAGAVGVRGTGSASAEDAAAAGRGFNGATEGMVRSSHPSLGRAFEILDSQIVRSPIPLETIMKFTKEGRLGRPGVGG